MAEEKVSFPHGHACGDQCLGWTLYFHCKLLRHTCFFSRGGRANMETAACAFAFVASALELQPLVSGGTEPSPFLTGTGQPTNFPGQRTQEAKIKHKKKSSHHFQGLADLWKHSLHSFPGDSVWESFLLRLVASSRQQGFRI
jgi:hypothetical protein